MLLFFNNFATTLALPCSDTDTTLYLQDMTGLPVPGADTFKITLQTPQTNDIEIVDVTAIDVPSKTITVVRGREFTIAKPFLIGAWVEGRLTRGILESFEPAPHNHDGVYSPLGHDHFGVYAEFGHDHAGVYEPLDAETVRRNIATEFTAQQNFAAVALADGANISWDLETQQAAIVTINGARTLDNPTNMVAGGTYELGVVQGIGGDTLAFGSLYDFGDAGTPALSTIVGKLDILTFVCDGGRLHGVASAGHTYAGAL